MDAHRRPPARRVALPVLAAALAVVLTACGGGSTASPAPSPISVDSSETAAKLVASKSPLFEGIGPKDPDLIGQASWWEAMPFDNGWRVTFRVGWGDCPAGCIDEHTWTYDMTRDGSVSVAGEAGAAVPQEILDQLRAAATVTGVAGRVTAGPTCPVESPNDPTCNARPVAGAVLVVKGAGGTEVARFTTDATGMFRIGLQPGDYTLEPQPVEGLMGTAVPMQFTVTDGSETLLDVSYDTGIR
jgi:hypothetical protein